MKVSFESDIGKVEIGLIPEHLKCGKFMTVRRCAKPRFLVVFIADETPATQAQIDQRGRVESVITSPSNVFAESK